MKKLFAKAGVILISALALSLPAHAQDKPSISPVLKKMLGGLPLAGIKDEVQGMLGALKKTSCGSKLSNCHMAQSGPLQLYVFSSSQAHQTLLLVIDKTIVMPRLLGDKVQKVMGETSLSAPIISISTTDFELDNAQMPLPLQKVVRDSYFNVNTLAFSSGVQVAARANLGGAIKLTMLSMGVNPSQLTMRAGVVMPIPTDLTGGAGAAAGVATAMQEGETMKKAGTDALAPEAFVEFQFAPNARLDLILPKVTLTDATFFINNALTFGYKGNAAFKGAEDKKIIMQFQTPLSPAGAMDLLDFEFRMATPASFTMEDAAHMMVGMATPDTRLARYGGGFIRNIDSLKEPLLAMVKPLSVVQLHNPQPPVVYRFGDSKYPFPDDIKYFNFALLGPLADGGPLLKAEGDVTVLGQRMGWLLAFADQSGLNGNVGSDIRLKLGPLGRVQLKLEGSMAINTSGRSIDLMGNFSGQKVKVGMSGSNLKVAGQAVPVAMTGGTLNIEVSSSCVNPFEIKTQVEIQASTNLADVFEGQGGVNVDPSKINGCVGQALEAAYKKITGEYSTLSGYTAAAANAELNKIANAAAEEAQRVAREAEKAAQDAQKAADAARREYDKTKDAARDVASKTSNAANKAFSDAGNAIKSIGKKKKHKKGPDPKFASSVFDWDYYYDHAPDVVAKKMDLATHWGDSGFKEGRQGSPEFNAKFYVSRYLDVHCGKGDYQCALDHWLDYGIQQGRQGSADVSIASYLNHYSDLQNAFGKDNYEDAMDHWLNDGSVNGRKANPGTSPNGPLAGSQRVGGGGGSAWTDIDTCNAQQVIGFRIVAGRLVDGVQFRYPSGWAPAQGSRAAATADVTLASGEYIVQVDYRGGGQLDSLSFKTNKGKIHGPYGGTGGTAGSYKVTAGQNLGCMTGRAGSSIDQLTFSSTGLR